MIWNFSFTIYILRNFLFNKKLNNCQNFCYNLCVDTSFAMYNCFEYNNIQHSMLSHSENNNINIHIYYQETLPTFILSVWLFIIWIWTLVYMKVIYNIKFCIFIRTRIRSHGCNANKYSRFLFLYLFLIYQLYELFSSFFDFISILCWKFILFGSMAVFTRECLILKISFCTYWGMFMLNISQEVHSYIIFYYIRNSVFCIWNTLNYV